MDKKSLYSDHVIRRRDNSNDSEESCKKFKEGNSELREFYSPNHPHNYTKKADCVRILEGRKLLLCVCLFVFSSLCFSVLQNSDCQNTLDGNGLEAGNKK